MKLYADNLYDFDSPQQSYWEATTGDIHVAAAPLRGNESCDVAVIGGGYTGLSVAYHLARDHDVDVRVLEAGHFGWGASGRNGGFCVPGGTATLAGDLVRLVGTEPARQFYRASVSGVERVRQLIADEDMDVQAQGSAEWYVAHTPRAFASLQENAAVARNILGLDCQVVSTDECRRQGFESSEQHGAMLSRPGFGLHPLQYCRGLAAAAVRRGAMLHEHSRVRSWQRDDRGWHRLSTAGGELRARRVVYAANGFMQEDLEPAFGSRSLPIISAIVVTRPLSEDELAAQGWNTEHPACNSRRILNYFRVLPDKRLMFGGRGRGTGKPSQEAESYRRLERQFKTIWPAWADVGVDFGWHGLICFTATLCPSIGRLPDDDSIYFGFGYHGNGVNMATETGKLLADWLVDGREAAVPDICRGLPKRFPLARWRRHYLNVGIRLAATLDRRG